MKWIELAQIVISLVKTMTPWGSIWNQGIQWPGERLWTAKYRYFTMGSTCYM